MSCVGLYLATSSCLSATPPARTNLMRPVSSQERRRLRQRVLELLGLDRAINQRSELLLDESIPCCRGVDRLRDQPGQTRQLQHTPSSGARARASDRGITRVPSLLLFAAAPPQSALLTQLNHRRVFKFTCCRVANRSTSALRCSTMPPARSHLPSPPLTAAAQDDDGGFVLERGTKRKSGMYRESTSVVY